MPYLRSKTLMELPFRKNHNIHISKNIKATVILLPLASILLLVISLNYPLLNYSSLFYKINSTYNPPSNDGEDIIKSTESQEKCDIFTGEWIPNPDAPYYTNTTCWAIHEHQNCMKYGRPDTEFLKWRWKPNGCELPVFDPYKFLDMVRNKSMAFVGDSVGRNQMQSMICLLSRVEYPIEVSVSPDDRFKRLRYETYNFTLATFWSPFLIRSEERSTDGPSHTGLFNLYLDEPDQSWTTQIDDFNFLILNAGHWFTRCSVFYQNHQIAGCRYCQIPNITDFPMTYGYRHAFQTALKSINARENFKGITFLRTFAPSHFENGLWNEGGNCVRRKPFRSNETSLEGMDLDLYMIQVEEFRVAEREGELGKKRFRFLDTTKAMLLRPDGHPSRYGHWPNENVTLYNDCVHWCLPGPIDTWADFLMHMMEMEGQR